MDRIKALIEGVTQDIIVFLVEEDGVTIEEAMDIFYCSEIFNKLNDSGTGLYRESSAYVMTLLRDELSHGKIIQLEV